MDGIRRVILVSACSLMCVGAVSAQSSGPGSSVTLRPTDTGRNITAAGRGTVRTPTQTRVRASSPGAATIPRFAIKTNLVYAAATLTPNLAFEYAFNERSSVEASVGFNRWGNLWDSKTTGPVYDPANYYKRRLDHIFAKAEYRYWFRGPFDGLFVGGGVFFAKYRVGELKLFNLFDKEFDYYGRLFGGSLSAGWMWRWSRRWATELSIGVGAATARHDKGLITTANNTFTVSNPVRVNQTYVGPTSAAIKIVFLIE